MRIFGLIVRRPLGQLGDLLGRGAQGGEIVLRFVRAIILRAALSPPAGGVR